MLTEKEAGRTRCCGPDDCGYENDGRWCIASQCMAWRWEGQQPVIVPEGAGALYDRLLSRGWTPGADSFAGVEMNPPQIPLGFCGLAGRPE